jgi:hypothetical protein
MSEIFATPSIEVEENPSIEDLFKELTELEPKPIGSFVPTNAAEQKEAFLSGDVRNPNHVYGKLDAIDFESNRQKIAKIGEKLYVHADTPDKYVGVYQQFIQNYIDKTNFMELAHIVKNTDSDEEKAKASADYMKLSIEVYGEPDETTYQSLIGEKIAKIKKKNLSEAGEKIRNELFELIDPNVPEKTERFKPSQETIDWLHDIADSEDSLYGAMLDHVPDQDTFKDEDIKSVFEKIIDQEFELLAKKPEDEGSLWQVVIEDAQSINVKAAEKKIVIPKGREINEPTMRALVAHEIGVHFLRSVMGEQTDLAPLKWGLSDYYDTEEGLGAVMEQAVMGEYKEAGIDHYITAGLAQFEGKDFRDIFETKWRLSLLSTTKGDPTEDDIAKAKSAAYGATMRIMRGTDELPWFKDLSYYNGAAEVWKHLESIRGDDTEFMLVLLGKANAGNKDHRRILLETATV